MQTADYVQFAVALIFVVGLIGLMAVILRRFGGGGIAMPRYRPDQKRRLHLVDALPLDPRRRLVLIRRDDVEHLVVLGPQSETVVESGIPAAGGDIGTADGAESRLSQRFDSVVRRFTRHLDDPANKDRARSDEESGQTGTEGRS